MTSCQETPLSEEEPCTWLGQAWEGEEPAFVEATSNWGLDEVLAVRVSVIDIDQDGWPDLLLRRGGGPDDFSDPKAGRSRFLLRNTGQGSFEDITQSSGLLQSRIAPSSETGRSSEVLVAGDVNNDGLVDVYLAQTVSDPNAIGVERPELMLGSPGGGFQLGPESSSARGTEHRLIPQGAALTDVNRDGKLDLWLSNNKAADDSSPLEDRLYLGQGDGSFVDATESLGLSTERWISVELLNEARGRAWGWGATACDLNRDGWPELMSASYGRAPNHLHLAEISNGELLYRNASISSGYAFDERLDWWTNVNAQCYCADNPQAEDCDLAPSPSSNVNCQSLWNAFGGSYRWSHSGDREPWRLGGNSATTTCADLDNDGWLDLLTGEIVHWDVGNNSDPAEILHNQGGEELRFERPGYDATGLLRELPDSGWDNGDMNNTVFDFDNDGRQDIYISSSDYPGTRGWLFQQIAPLQFQAVPSDEAIDHPRSAGVSAADLDRDGDLDLIVGHSRMRCSGSSDCFEQPYVRIFENQHGSTNRWLQLQLVGGEGTNRSAIGARVELSACSDRPTRVVDGGHGHVGVQDDPMLHFGAGQLETAEVTVTWPDANGSTETATLDTNARYRWVQGESPTPLSL